MRQAFIQTRFLPHGSTPVTREGVDAVVYIWTNQKSRPCAIGFRGKSNKPAFNNYFINEDRRQQYIDDFFNRIVEHEQDKKSRREQKKNFQHSLKVGDILHYSWGYDQTNCEYWQVTEVKGKMVTLKEIAQKRDEENQSGGIDSAHYFPVKDKFLTQEYNLPVTKLVLEGNCVKFDHGYGSLCSEKESHYASWGH